MSALKGICFSPLPGALVNPRLMDPLQVLIFSRLRVCGQQAAYRCRFTGAPDELQLLVGNLALCSQLTLQVIFMSSPLTTCDYVKSQSSQVSRGDTNHHLREVQGPMFQDLEEAILTSLFSGGGISNPGDEALSGGERGKGGAHAWTGRQLPHLHRRRQAGQTSVISRFVLRLACPVS